MSSPIERFKNITLDNDYVIAYRAEASKCYAVDGFRAAITMVWCVMIYHIYKKIEEFGLYDFVRSVHQKGIVFSGNINNFYDLEKIKDNDIITMCRERGFYDDTVKKKLINLCDTRNACSHFNLSTVNQNTADAFINDVCNYIEFLQNVNFTFEPNFFNTLKKMGDTGLKHTAASMSFERLKLTFVKILDTIASIQNYEEYQEDENLIKFIEIAILARSEEEIIALYDILFKRVIVADLNWTWEIRSLIYRLTSRSYIQSYILENGYLDLLVSKLCDSNSYEIAANSSKAVLNFNSYLTQENIFNIANGIVENSQISDSYGAKPNLKNILLYHKKLLTIGLVEKLKGTKFLE